jgi:hypothetical protein
MNTGIKGIRGFNTNWQQQDSGNIKRVYDEYNIKIILRKRGDAYEVHAWRLSDDKHICATKLGGPSMLYWRLCDDSILPAQLDMRAAKRLVDRQFDMILKALE